MPPNGHGITALMALQILEGFAAGAEKEDPLVYHRCIEAIKLAFADTKNMWRTRPT
jgi:gamma-glutamyltranspeptidase/glutathione hydrolase